MRFLKSNFKLAVPVGTLNNHEGTKNTKKKQQLGLKNALLRVLCAFVPSWFRFSEVLYALPGVALRR